MNKRIISLLMALVMMLSLLPTPALAAEETPIRSESDLAAMAGGSYVLTEDIVLSDGWTPVANFSGTLNGNGHTVTLAGKPLIQSIARGGLVSNLILRGSVTSDADVGALAAVNNGTVRNCLCYADVTYTGNGGGAWFAHHVAGLVGYANVSDAVLSNSLYAGVLNYGSAQAYGTLTNNGDFVKGTVTHCVGVGADRVGTSTGMSNDPIPDGDNRNFADAGAFIPEEQIAFLNEGRTETDLEWIRGEDGQLTIQSQVTENPEATPEELAALDEAIAAGEGIDRTQIYTAESWKTFADAMKAAQEVKDAPNKPQTAVTEATAKLNEAVAGISLRSVGAVSADGMQVVELDQSNFKDHLKAPEDGVFYRLTADITLPKLWLGSTKTFNAVLDGDGHTITLVGAPLYGAIGASGVIQNLGILGTTQSSEDTGALAKDCFGLVVNCWSRAEVSSEGLNGIRKNTGSFVANLRSGGGVVNTYAAGKLSCKGSQGEGVMGALVGVAEENSLLRSGYYLTGMADGAAGAANGITENCENRSADALRTQEFADLLNSGKGENGKTWRISAEGWPHFGEGGDFKPETGVTLRYTPAEGYGSNVRDFDSVSGLELSLADAFADSDAQEQSRYAGVLSYPGFDGQVAFVPQYEGAGQGDHKVFVSENGQVEILGAGSLEVAVCDRDSWSGSQYDRELARFRIVVTNAQIDGLRLVPTGKYVTGSAEQGYQVAGSGEVRVLVQVQTGGAWKNASATMAEMKVDGDVFRSGSTFTPKKPGLIRVSAAFGGKHAQAEVTSTYVPVSMIRPAPSGTYVIHERNANSSSMGDFLDLTLDHQAGSVIVEPENASYRDAWKLDSSDPTIAKYVPEFLLAVLPYRAGTVTLTASTTDPQQEKQVTGTSQITLEYFNPVTQIRLEGGAVTVKENETMDLPLVFSGEKTPQGYHVSEPGMTWSFSGDGEVEIVRNGLGVLIRNDKEYCVANDRYQIIGVKEGVVTVTGTPVDQTGGAKPVTFTVTVASGTPEPEVDHDQLIGGATEGALAYMDKAYEGWTYRYGDEWNVFLMERMGRTVSAQQKQSYLDSIVKTYENPKNSALKPTTIARVVLAVTALGEDAANVGGVDLIDLLCRGKFMTAGSNEPIWALIALDSAGYTVPAGAAWDRQKLIDRALTYQNPDNGGFGLNGNDEVGTDMTAMAIQALAPYRKDPKVQTAIDAGLGYLKHEMDRNCDFGTSETIAQVIIALGCLDQDPLDPANGFVRSSARDLVTALCAYKMDDGGFRHLMAENKSQNMSTLQALMAFESYRRVKAGQPNLYDMTEKTDPEKPTEPSEPKPTEPETKPSEPAVTEPSAPGSRPTDPATQPTKPGGSQNRPATGDPGAAVYAVGLLVSAAALAAVVVMGRKKSRR